MKTTGDHAFSSSGIKQISLPKSLVSIGSYSFGSCSSLTDITFLNGSPKEVEISFSDGSSVICEFPRDLHRYMVVLSQPVVTKTVRVTILSAYTGKPYEDTCITDVYLYN